MATTSDKLATGKALAGQGGDRNGGRYGLRVKLAAGVAILGCAGTLAFGGLRATDSGSTQPAIAPGVFTPANVALARTLAGDGYLEFSVGEAAVAVPASGAAVGGGLSEFLPSDEPTSDGGGVPGPVYGPQP
jgi:hypothetical protein